MELPGQNKLKVSIKKIIVVLYFHKNVWNHIDSDNHHNVNIQWFKKNELLIIKLWKFFCVCLL